MLPSSPPPQVNTFSDQHQFWTGPEGSFRYFPAVKISEAYYSQAGAILCGG